MQFSNLLETAASHADSSLTIRAGDGPLTVKSFPELVADVRTLRDRLAQAGLRAGHYVGMQAANTYAFVVWDLALIELGAIAHVFPEHWSLADMRAVADKFRLAFCVGAQFGNAALPAGDAATLNVQIANDCDQCDDPDMLTRVYSSGTSGYLKGLVIGRRGVEDVATQFAESFFVTPRDRHLFFLTMAHFQQRLTVYTCMYAGVSMMITPYTHVFHDIPRFKPTFLVGPPMFYEVALSTLVPRGAEADAARRLSTVFGSQLRFMITGMAPIRRAVLETYQRCNIPLQEAYGMTEVGLIAWNTPGDNRVGAVGRPLKSHQLVFTSESEILVKAPHSFAKRYFDVDPQESAKTFLPDGFIATGDIGEMVGTHLVLRGRKKDIIVTSDGHKFHPSAIEERILVCPEVRQAAVVTDVFRNDILAIVSVDDPQDPATRTAVEQIIDTANQAIASSARIARTIITETRFSPDNGLLTPTLKPNRSQIARTFSSPREVTAHG